MGSCVDLWSYANLQNNLALPIWRIENDSARDTQKSICAIGTDYVIQTDVVYLHFIGKFPGIVTPFYRQPGKRRKTLVTRDLQRHSYYIFLPSSVYFVLRNITDCSRSVQRFTRFLNIYTTHPFAGWLRRFFA